MWEIDLKWRANEWLFIAHVLQKCIGILCTSSQEIHCESIGCSKLYILAAVEEALSELFRDVVLDSLDSGVSIRTRLRGLLGLCDVQELGLIRGAGKGAEEVSEIVAACGT